MVTGQPELQLHRSRPTSIVKAPTNVVDVAVDSYISGLEGGAESIKNLEDALDGKPELL